MYIRRSLVDSPSISNVVIGKKRSKREVGGGRWEVGGGRMEDGRMGGWEGERVGRWEGGRVGRWEGGRVGGREGKHTLKDQELQN